MRSSFSSFHPSLLLLNSLLSLLLTPTTTLAQQLFSPSINLCPGTTADILSFTSAFVQIVPQDIVSLLDLGFDRNDTEDGRRILRIDLFGDLRTDLPGYDNTTGKLATLFTHTGDVTYNVYSSTSYACSSLFPPSPLPGPYIPGNTTYCPLTAGPIGLNLSIPLSGSFGLSTLNTKIRLVDSSVPPKELTCVNVELTPYYPGAWYYSLFLWLPVALVIAYWVTTWAGRFAAGWIVGRMSMGTGTGAGMGEGELGGSGTVVGEDVDGWGKRGGAGRRWGTMVISGLSGERVGVSGGLLRFITPGFRDVIFHLQFCAILAMVAVNWPPFVYPILSKSAWASLVWNTTIVADTTYDLLASNTNADSIPSGFRDQVSNQSLPLYLDSSIPNSFLNLNSSSRTGIPAFANSIGINDIDLFGTCLALFLMIAAGIILVSILIWVLHGLLTSLLTPAPPPSSSADYSRPPKHPPVATTSRSSESLDATPADKPTSLPSVQKTTSLLPTLRSSVATTAPMPTPVPLHWKRAWWRFKIKGPIGAFHWSALCGNLVRLLILFHLPITCFCSYQWTQRSRASTATIVLSAIAFAAFSIILPVYLLVRVAKTPTGKLYDATRTLLSLGPIYNLYAQGKQMYQGVRFLANLVTGIVVGAGQRNGTAQAVVLLVVEIAWGLLTTIWQPWRPGAGMAIPTFIFTVIRIISVVLLLILSPAIDISTPVAGWVAYVILLLQAIAFVYFLVMLFCKILEGCLRLFGNVKFDESTHPLDGGLLAAFGGLRLPGRRKARNQRDRRRRQNAEAAQTSAGSINTQMMLDRYSTNTSLPYTDTDYPPAPGSPVQRGFSVVGGGKAEYRNPYAALPMTTRSHAYAPTPLYPVQEADNNAPPPPSSFVVNRAAPTKHTRTRSQTAIIEPYPTSQHTSPANVPIQIVDGSPEQSSPPSRTPSGHMTSSRASPQSLLPLLTISNAPALMPNRFDDDEDDDENSPTYSYEDDEEQPQKRVADPRTWFNRAKRNSTGGTNEEVVIDGGHARKSVGETSWLSSLRPGSARRDSQAAADAERSNENIERKSEIEPDVSSVNRQASRRSGASGETRRSFQVNRMSRTSTISKSPRTSAQNSPIPVPSPLPDIQSDRSFVVSRPDEILSSPPRYESTLDPLTSPSPVPSTGTNEPPKGSFVVNRANRPSPSSRNSNGTPSLPVRFAPVKDSQ